jgi:Phage Mu protein F like protein
MGHPDLEFAWSDKRPVDPADQAQILDVYAQRGIVSINECRDILGLDPIPGGDVATIDIAGQGPVPVAQLGETSRRREVDQGGETSRRRDIDQGGETSRRREVGKRAAVPFAHPASSPARVRAAARIKAAVASFFSEEASRVAGEVYRSQKVGQIAPVSRLAKAVRDITHDDDHDDDQVTPVDQDRHLLDALIAAALLRINFARWTVLIQPVAAALTDLGSDTFDDAVDAVGAPDKVGSVLEWAKQWALKRAAELVGRKWIGDQTVEDPDAEMAVTESTRNMLKPVIERALKECLTQAEFAAGLAQSVFSRARAERIGNFEATNAYHRATLEAFKQSGKVDAVRWVTMSDDLVEEICEDNEDAGPIAVGDTFPSGDDAPPAHLDCRCWLEAVEPSIDR